MNASDTDRRTFSRRGVFGLAASAIVVGGGVFAARWFNVTASLDGETLLSAPDAHMAATTGEILLVDIRRPDEWQWTGIGEGAVPLDMRRRDFVPALLAAVQGDETRAVALICARGVRSRYLAAQLAEVGFTNVLDVPEGMMGSGAGPGWLKRGLPVRPWQEGQG